MSDDNVTTNQDALTLYRRLSSSTVSSSFQTQKQDQFGGQVYNRSNTALADLATSIGYAAQASGKRSTAISAYAYAKEDDSTAAGVYAQAFGRYSTVLGSGSRGLKYATTVVGRNSLANGLNSVIVGTNSSITHDNVILLGNDLHSTEAGEIQIGSRFIVNSSGEIVIDGINVTQQLASVMGLPFAGVLGDGRHGALNTANYFTSASVTATSPIPIYQLTTLDLAAGKTWVCYQPVVPSGFIISVQGRCTIAGTMTCAGRGAGGGPASATIGASGFAGFGWAATGGGGGGSSTAIGGMGAPVRVYTPFGGSDPGGIAPGTGNTQWGAETTAATYGIVRAQSGMYGHGSRNGGTAGNAGQAGNSVSAAYDTTLFPTLWALYRSQIWGWGSGGGAGATNVSNGTGGAGGGYVVILCDELDFTGTINANGANGINADGANGGGGGGGGGGTVVIGYRTLIANSGTVNVNGGTGGTGGAGGGAGGAGGVGYSNIFDMRI